MKESHRPASRLRPRRIERFAGLSHEGYGHITMESPELIILTDQERLAEGRCSACDMYFSVSQSKLSREALEHDFTTHIGKCQGRT